MASATIELMEVSFSAAMMRILRSRSFSILIVRLTLVEAGCFSSSLVFAIGWYPGVDRKFGHIQSCYTIICAAQIVVQHDFVCYRRKKSIHVVNLPTTSYLAEARA